MKQLLRMAASLTATVLGGVLLIADGDMCSRYAAFRGSARYVADCGELASGEGVVSLDLPATDSDAEPTLQETAKQQLDAGGLHVSRAYINYEGSCTGSKDRAVASSLLLTFSSEKSGDYRCTELELPVSADNTMICRPANETSAQANGAPACTIKFRPPER